MTAPCRQHEIILLVEDDPNDAFFLQWAFRNSCLSHSVYVAFTGAHAINYLAGNGPFADRQYFPLPCLVILNLHLSGLSGPAVLEWIRNTTATAHIRVITLASLPQPEIPI